MTDKFNENLKKARQDAHMTQGEVAIKIGVAKNTYCNWELGKREPDIMKIKALERGGWSTPHVMQKVYRHALADKVDPMALKAVSAFQIPFQDKYT